MDDCKRLHIVNGVESDLINIQDRAFQYGDGLFETIAVINGSPALLDLHLNRLTTGLERLSFPAIDFNQLRQSILDYSGKFQQAILKLIVTRGQAERGYTPPAQPEITTVISIAEHVFAQSYSDYLVKRLEICDTQLSDNPQLAGIKHLNRLEQVLASIECQQKQYQDCILINPQGLVIEAVSANVFTWKNDKLFTPDLERCGIAGVMRQKVIELAKQLEIPVEVGLMTQQDILSAEAVFLTNSIRAIQPVAEIQSVQLDPANWPTHLYEEVMRHAYP